jgi:PIN domain nuclease of toxin-antitoxin system
LILLDTHVFYWAAAAPQKLSRAAVRAVERSGRAGGLSIASVTLFELAQAMRSGRIRGGGSVHGGIQEFLEAIRPVVHELSVDIAVAAAELPRSFPGDPMDRLIAATSIVAGMPLVTKDERMLESPLLDTIW